MSHSRNLHSPLPVIKQRATDPEALKKIPAPSLGIFGAQDRGVSTDVRKFGEALDPMGKKIEIKIYHDAGDAFANPNDARRRCLEAQGRVSSDDAGELMAMRREIQSQYQ